MNEILTVVSRYTSFFDDKSCNSFVQWCIRRKINFMKAAVSRKRTRAEKEKIGFRILYIIKREFIDNVAESIAAYLPRYQEYIGNLHKEGHQVIGYARKSIGSEDEDTRIRLLQTMIEQLVKRPLVKKVFVSLSGKISTTQTNVSVFHFISSLYKNWFIDFVEFFTKEHTNCLFLSYIHVTLGR
ncbi:hypothetical protein RMCBS344292_13081 [Rhizopus microsporus]|nr:hypothetical protein RMCBS344292_13081 [Rhizopus microsporus]